MELGVLLAFAVVFVVDSLTPGPAVMTAMAKGAAHRHWSVLPFIAGLVLSDLALFALAVAGLVALAATYAPAFVILKWLGIGYLLFMAWRLWRSVPMALQASAPMSVKPGPFRNFGLGLLLPFANPKAIGFYVAILPTVMTVDQLNPATLLAISAIICLVWSLSLWAYAFAGDRASALMRTPTGQRMVNRCAGATMAGSAAWLAAR